MHQSIWLVAIIAVSISANPQAKSAKTPFGTVTYGSITWGTPPGKAVKEPTQPAGESQSLQQVPYCVQEKPDSPVICYYPNAAAPQGTPTKNKGPTMPKFPNPVATFKQVAGDVASNVAYGIADSISKASGKGARPRQQAPAAQPLPPREPWALLPQHQSQYPQAQYPASPPAPYPVQASGLSPVAPQTWSTPPGAVAPVAAPPQLSYPSVSKPGQPSDQSSW